MLAVAMALSLVPTVEARATTVSDVVGVATNIAFGGNTTGDISSPTQENWYSFTTPEYAANYTVTLSNAASSAHTLRYYLYDSNSSVKGKNTCAKSKSAEDDYKLEPNKTYYLEVLHNANNHSCKGDSYTLTVSCEKEEPDSQETAETINLNESKTGQIFTKDDEDWFTFTTSNYNRSYSIYVANNSEYSNGSASYNKLGYYVYDAEQGSKCNEKLTAQHNATTPLALDPGKTYYIKFDCASSASYYKEPYNYTFTLKAEDLTGLGTTGVTVSALTKGFNVTWNAVANADGYELRYSKSADMSGATTVSALTATSQKITSLPEKTTYYVQVRACVGSSTGTTVYSDWSEAKAVTTDVESLSTPAVTVSRRTGGFYAKWDEVTYADCYELRYSTLKDMSNATTVSYLTSTSKKITGLNVNTLYYVQIHAYVTLSTGEKLYSDWSEKMTVSTDLTSLDAANVTVTPLVKGFKVKWDAVTYADGYEVCYSTKEDMSDAETIALKATAKKITGLEENAAYYVQVRAYTKLSTGEKLYSEWSNEETVVTDVSSLSAPTVSVSATSKGFIVKWKKVENAAKYEIRCSTKKNMANAKKITVTSKSKRVTGLKAKKTYYVQVRACATRSTGKKIYSKWSTVKTVTTKK